MVTAPFRVVLDANVLFPHVDSKKAKVSTTQTTLQKDRPKKLALAI